MHEREIRRLLLGRAPRACCRTSAARGRRARRRVQRRARLRAAALHRLRRGVLPRAGDESVHGVPRGLEHLPLLEREQRAGLPVRARLRERDAGVRNVRARVLQGQPREPLVHCVPRRLRGRGARRNAARAVPVPRGLLLRARRRRREELPSVRGGHVQGGAGRRRVHAVSGEPLLPRERGRARAVPAAQPLGAGERARRGLPLRRGLLLRVRGGRSRGRGRRRRRRLRLPRVRAGKLHGPRRAADVHGVPRGHVQPCACGPGAHSLPAVPCVRGEPAELLAADAVLVQPGVRRGARRELHAVRARTVPREPRRVYMRGVPVKYFLYSRGR